MTQKHTNTKVPKLRFQEYKNDWHEKRLSDLLTFKNGVNASKNDYGNGYKFINVLDIINNNFINYENIIGLVNISESEFKKNIVEYGDILFQRSSETREDVGQANVYLDKTLPATFGGFVIRGKKKGEYNPLFLNFLLKTKSARKEITSKSGGSTRFNVGQDTLSSVLIKTTSLKEQQKIASFLSSVDKKITLLQQKKELLEQYKKGIMQKTFSQELRFKPALSEVERDDNGNEYPKWEEKSLNELIELIIDNRGKTPPISKSGISLIEVNAIGNKNIDYTKVSKFVSKEVYNDWFRNHIKKNDVLFSTVGQTAMCALYDEKNKSAIAQNIVGLRFKKGFISTFLFYLLTESNNNRKFKRIEMGAVQPSVKVSQMVHLKFLLPKKEEQTKIADFLSAIDHKIQLVNTQLENTQTFKKGLLQQMFV